MNTEDQIANYIADQPEPKRDDMQALHRLMLHLAPGCRLWFLDGRNEDGKIVSNPNIGYGLKPIEYANGATRDFYRIGLSANTAGISIYVMGMNDKKYLFETYGGRLGKASITGYCVKFKALKDLNPDVLEDLIRFALGA